MMLAKRNDLGQIFSSKERTLVIEKQEMDDFLAKRKGFKTLMETFTSQEAGSFYIITSQERDNPVLLEIIKSIEEIDNPHTRHQPKHLAFCLWQSLTKKPEDSSDFAKFWS
jgi:hypothetical protein